MTDYISREAALNLIKELHAEAESPEASEALFEAHERIAELPAADVVPVVRCGDCKYSYEDLSGRVCVKGPCVDCYVPDDFFCKNGERRE